MRAQGFRMIAGSVLPVSCLVAGLVAGMPAAGAADPDALVRVAHFSPDTPGVDVYLTGFAGGTTRLWVPNAAYGGVSSYRRLPAGLYVVAMRPHGAAASSPPAIRWNLDVKAGRAYTTAAIGPNADLRSIVLHDDLSLPPAGDGRVRLVQAASQAPRATVRVVGGPTIATGATFGSTTGYRTVPAGTWTLQANGTAPAAVSTDARVAIAAGSVTSLLLLDTKQGGITVRTVLDASAPGAIPVGPVPAGGGGTAPVLVGRPGGRVAGPAALRAGAMDALLATALLLGLTMLLGKGRRRWYRGPHPAGPLRQAGRGRFDGGRPGG